MQAEVLNIKGENSGRTVELPDEIFAIEPNDHVVYLAVKQYLSAKHQGTHKSKKHAQKYTVQAANCIARKVRAAHARAISATLYTKAAVLCLAPNPMATILS